MPLVPESSFPGAPWWQPGGHLQTLLPGLLRRVTGVDYQRERIATPDGDFLDLDWLKQSGSRQLVIVTHGLEGSSQAQYCRGTAKYFAQNGWDALAWNCRSCSGEMNRAFRLYHHGDTADISTVVQHALQSGNYQCVALVGYSMGGNITLKYVGTQGAELPAEVKAAVAFSAPCDIRAGADVLDRWDNRVYKKRFLYLLKQKIVEKNRRFPGRLDVSKLKKVRRWRDFDTHFSAPICGFASADDFHDQASAKNFIAGTRIPTLLVSAKNDPILTPECFPVELAREHPYFYLELTDGGGHCGFLARNSRTFSWAEQRALDFVAGVVGG
jgi:predicted alpha/beta-fold hydrolase